MKKHVCHIKVSDGRGVALLCCTLSVLIGRHLTTIACDKVVAGSACAPADVSMQMPAYEDGNCYSATYSPKTHDTLAGALEGETGNNGYTMNIEQVTVVTKQGFAAPNRTCVDIVTSDPEPANGLCDVATAGGEACLGEGYPT